MAQISFIEDIFCQFYANKMKNNSSFDIDYQAATNFYLLLNNDEQLTFKQANYLLRILKNHGLDVSQNTWKKEFRKIDTTRKVSVVEDSDGIYFCFKFPYNFKEKFDSELLVDRRIFSQWDQENKVRKLNFYDHNILKIYEFCKNNNFTFDDSFNNVYDQVEEIWQQEEKIKQHSLIENSQVILKNASESAIEFWQNNMTSSLNDNLLLAKKMGYYLKNPSRKNLIEKISSSQATNFWIDDLSKFFEIYKQITGKVCVVLDRTIDLKPWIENFVRQAKDFDIPKQDIKVCFREKNENKDNINDWIKDRGLGGKVDSGKIFIFLHAPSKWFFKDFDSFQILLLNFVVPPTHNNVQSLIQTYPLVLHTENIKPTLMRTIKIEKL